MAVEGANYLVTIVTFLGAAIIAVPLFKKIGLGPVLGYLAAGVAIGPFGLGLFSDSTTIIHIAELGVVMFLFLVGLEIQPKQLWGLRKYIFGMGSLQVLGATAALTAIGLLYNFSLQFSFIAASGFVLTSTAIVMQTLSYRNDMTSDPSRRIIAVLLFEDLLIVPLLALVAILSPAQTADSLQSHSLWQHIIVSFAGLALLIVAGIWLLDPLFRLVAKTKIRELMTAVALFVVLGSALLMEATGLSMAMGAFLAGVLLSNSSFRHQLEVDIDPFKGLLLGLFFLGVGMSLDLTHVLNHWKMILSALFLMMITKGIIIYAVARATGSTKLQSMDRAVLMAQGGEFAFVLFSSAALQGVISAEVHANMTAIVVLSMALTPLFIVIYQKWIAPKFAVREVLENDVIEEQNDIILIGLGRFGQIVNHLLRASGFQPTIIDKDAKLINGMKKHGIRSYFGDACHPDLLHRAGIETVKLVIVAIDNTKQATKIVRHIRQINPKAKIIARAYDRHHVFELAQAGANVQIRETFDSALRTGKQALTALGIEQEKVHRIGNMFFGKDRHSVKLMADVFAPKKPMFTNEDMLKIALEQDEALKLEIQKILTEKR